MPARKSKSSKTAQPPLPDEAPPLPNEQPPLPDEAPPLPNEQPPLPDEQPPLPNEQPPLPDEQPPLPNEQSPVSDERVTSSGAQKEQESKEGADREDDKSDNEGSEKGKGKDKGKAKETGEKSPSNPDPAAWQAVWAPEQNAYYFWNKESGEVTWSNPLVAADAPPLPDEPAPASSSSAPPRPIPSSIPDIDPALAHLLPPEQRGSDGAPIAGLKFAPQDYNYSFTHLDEYNRAKRFSEHYFDVDAWEKQKAAEGLKRKAEEEAGITITKKITKKDMDRFRAKKAEQKARRQAWLYD